MQAPGRLYRESPGTMTFINARGPEHTSPSTDLGEQHSASSGKAIWMAADEEVGPIVLHGPLGGVRERESPTTDATVNVRLNPPTTEVATWNGEQGSSAERLVEPSERDDGSRWRTGRRGWLKPCDAHTEGR